ncbi:metallophosphoesterase [Arenibacter sp. M-2]|uniref:metallophosphoesterase n=1 Tax=Arenibacter sp. M-2 TaxID=3053612 RepID=UPI00256FEB3E|nr:metallophosphoesterase [Arenibacter sp. M-2]MDL5514981.1 metallophosphoesterase [Arenibacter sp. M-2]
MIKKSTFLLVALSSVYSFSQTSHVDLPNVSDVAVTMPVSHPQHSTSVTVVRGPYLQSGTPTSVVVKWRTDFATESVVHYGKSLKSLSKKASSNNVTTEHEVALSGLSPNTKYYFNIGNKAGVLSESVSGEMYIITAPKAGTKQFVRAWILGDAGTANNNQRNVRDAYYDYVDAAPKNSGKTDMMLFLGDNAYGSGTDEQYQNALFDIYDDMLKKSVAWSCLGNHDGKSADSATQSGPYYDIFTFPTAAQAGGIASGTEAYYSFDYANIHFIILDSHHTSREVGGAMYNWTKADIQNTKQDWIVTLFHHPVYTKGSHDSDTEDRLIEMRQNFMPMMEANGVDLILNGHSHSYERSYFLNGHYGFANTFNPDNISKGGHTVGSNGYGDGKVDSNGAYQKANTAAEGAVYITTGSAGKISGGDLNHQAMSVSLNQLGSCVMEVEDDGRGGQNLTVKFIRDNDGIDDYFTINKSARVLNTDRNASGQKSAGLLYDADKDLVRLDVDKNDKLKKVKFYNNIGKLVKKSRRKTINVGKLPKGLYVIEVITNQKAYTESITIE